MDFLPPTGPQPLDQFRLKSSCDLGSTLVPTLKQKIRVDSISWNDLENPVSEIGAVLTFSFPMSFSEQRFYRVVETP